MKTTEVFSVIRTK